MLSTNRQITAVKTKDGGEFKKNTTLSGMVKKKTTTTTTTTTKSATTTSAPAQQDLDTDNISGSNNRIETLRWIPDEEKTNCTQCKKAFTVLTRRHHCRACGEIFCAECASMKVIIPRGRIISKNMRNPKDDWKVPLRACTTCAVSLGHKPPPSTGAQRYIDGTLPADIPMVNRRWVPDTEQGKCIGCDRPFTLVRRRHHCRCCGLIFCFDCSSDKCLIPKQLIITPESAAAAKKDQASGHRLRTCHRCSRALETVQEDLRALDPRAELSYQRRSFQKTDPKKVKKKKPVTTSHSDEETKAPKNTGTSGAMATTTSKSTKTRPKTSSSSSASVGGGNVSSSASVGAISASRKVSFDNGSVFSASPSVMSAQTAPPAFLRHSPFQVVDTMTATSASSRRVAYSRDDGDKDDNAEVRRPSRVESLRKQYADTTNSFSKSASIVSKSASNAREKISERLSTLREGLGKGVSVLSFRVTR